MTTREFLKIRAVRSEQGNGIGVYAFFIYGADINRIADISRIRRDDNELKGFQRREIRDHVKEITAFLDSGPVLFPNAIILALSPEVEFARSRGRAPGEASEVGETGTLSIPIYPEGRRAAWIVDGQQRSLALGAAKNSAIAVPVVGFVSDVLTTQREQFILVNKVKPLPTALINELLPEVSVLLPRDLAAKQLPSALCAALNTDPNSPFHGLIKRESDRTGIVTDTALIETMKASLKTAAGALGQFKQNGWGTTPPRCMMHYYSIGAQFATRSQRRGGVSRPRAGSCTRQVFARWERLWTRLMLRADAAPDKAAAVREYACPFGAALPLDGRASGMALDSNGMRYSQHRSILQSSQITCSILSATWRA